MLIQGTLLLLLYVDDMIITGDNQAHLDWFVLQSSTEFSMKDLGPLYYFLGIEVNHSPDGLFLCQCKYAKELLLRANMQGCKIISTPMAFKSRSICGQYSIF